MDMDMDMDMKMDMYMNMDMAMNFNKITLFVASKLMIFLCLTTSLLWF
jgi:hypothetical protein